METAILVFVAVLSVGAAYVWGRSARLRLRLLGRLESDLRELDQQDSVAQRAAITLTRSDFRRDIHAARRPSANCSIEFSVPFQDKFQNKGLDEGRGQCAERDQQQLQRAQGRDAHLDDPVVEIAPVAAQEVDHRPLPRSGGHPVAVLNATAAWPSRSA